MKRPFQRRSKMYIDDDIPFYFAIENSNNLTKFL